jgi:hypothetical protein
MRHLLRGPLRGVVQIDPSAALGVTGGLCCARGRGDGTAIGTTKDLAALERRGWAATGMVGVELHPG